MAYRKSPVIRNVRMATPADYRIVAEWLDCKQVPGRLSCIHHRGVWLDDRCLVANAIALKLASKLHRMERRITSLADRPTDGQLQAARQQSRELGYNEGLFDGLMEAYRVMGTRGIGRADWVLKRHIVQNYGDRAKKVFRRLDTPHEDEL